MHTLADSKDSKCLLLGELGKANMDEIIEIRDMRNGSWLWVSKTVLADTRLTHADYRVYSGLASFAGEGKDGQTIYPSISAICKRVGVSARQIKLSTTRLTALKYIQKAPHQQGNKTLYTLLKVRSSATITPQEGVVQPLPTVVQPLPDSGANGKHEVASNNILLTKLTNEKDNLSSLRSDRTAKLKEQAHALLGGVPE